MKIFDFQFNDSEFQNLKSLYLSKAENIFEGVAVNGKALGGVIHQPFFGHELENTAELGRTIWGYVGLGAFGNFQQIKLTEKPVKITVTRFLFNQMISKFKFFYKNLILIFV